jgi:eukaryotic-like serine/threonine-protein kinase
VTARRRLLEAALAYYQEFIELRRDDPTAQAELEHTRDRVRAILADLRVLAGAGQHMLLIRPDVQTDLKLTADQRAVVAGILKGIGESRPFPRPAPDDRPRKMLDEVKAHQAAIEAVLSPAQLARLGQIALQVRGPMAFREPDVVDRLGLTPEQRERLRGIEQDVFAFRPLDGPKKGPGPRFDMERVLAVLSPEQRATWMERSG